MCNFEKLAQNDLTVEPTKFLHRSTVIKTDSGGLMLAISSSFAIALKFVDEKSFVQGLLVIYDCARRCDNNNHLGKS